MFIELRPNMILIILTQLSLYTVTLCPWICVMSSRVTYPRHIGNDQAAIWSDPIRSFADPETSKSTATYHDFSSTDDHHLHFDKILITFSESLALAPARNSRHRTLPVHKKIKKRKRADASISIHTHTHLPWHTTTPPHRSSNNKPSTSPPSSSSSSSSPSQSTTSSSPPPPPPPLLPPPPTLLPETETATTPPTQRRSSR